MRGCCFQPVVLALLAIGAARGAEVAWVGGEGSRWGDGGSWAGGAVPAPNSPVAIGRGLNPSGGAVLVSTPAGLVEVWALSICPPEPPSPSAPKRAVVLTIPQGSVLRVANGLAVCAGAELRVLGGALELTGNASEVFGGLALRREGMQQGEGFSLKLTRGATLTVGGNVTCDSCSALVQGSLVVTGALEFTGTNSTLWGAVGVNGTLVGGLTNRGSVRAGLHGGGSVHLTLQFTNEGDASFLSDGSGVLTTGTCAQAFINEGAGTLTLEGIHLLPSDTRLCAGDTNFQVHNNGLLVIQGGTATHSKVSVKSIGVLRIPQGSSLLQGAELYNKGDVDVEGTLNLSSTSKVSVLFTTGRVFGGGSLVVFSPISAAGSVSVASVALCGVRLTIQSALNSATSAVNLTARALLLSGDVSVIGPGTLRLPRDTHLSVGGAQPLCGHDGTGGSELEVHDSSVHLHGLCTAHAADLDVHHDSSFTVEATGVLQMTPSIGGNVVRAGETMEQGEIGRFSNAGTVELYAPGGGAQAADLRIEAKFENTGRVSIFGGAGLTVADKSVSKPLAGVLVVHKDGQLSAASDLSLSANLTVSGRLVIPLSRKIAYLHKPSTSFRMLADSSLEGGGRLVFDYACDEECPPPVHQLAGSSSCSIEARFGTLKVLGTFRHSAAFSLMANSLSLSRGSDLDVQDGHLAISSGGSLDLAQYCSIIARPNATSNTSQYAHGWVHVAKNTSVVMGKLHEIKNAGLVTEGTCLFGVDGTCNDLQSSCVSGMSGSATIVNKGRMTVATFSLIRTGNSSHSPLASLINHGYLLFQGPSIAMSEVALVNKGTLDIRSETKMQKGAKIVQSSPSARTILSSNATVRCFSPVGVGASSQPEPCFDNQMGTLGGDGGFFTDFETHASFRNNGTLLLGTEGASGGGKISIFGGFTQTKTGSIHSVVRGESATSLNLLGSSSPLSVQGNVFLEILTTSSRRALVGSTFYPVVLQPARPSAASLADLAPPNVPPLTLTTEGSPFGVDQMLFGVRQVTCPVVGGLCGAVAVTVVGCPAGQYVGASGGCTPCAEGTYLDEPNEPECRPCNAGTFQPAQGATTCEVCGIGNFSEPAATACTQCPLGHVSATNGSSTCTPCPGGAFQPVVGGSACTLCVAGTYSSKAGSSVCMTCAAGTAQNAGGAVACKVCEGGTYADATGMRACRICGPGTYAQGLASRSCVSCSAGSFAPLNGSSVCTACPSDYFAALPSARTCTPCPPKTSAPTKGSTRCLSPCEAAPHLEGCSQTPPPPASPATPAPPVKSLPTTAVLVVESTPLPGGLEGGNSSNGTNVTLVPLMPVVPSGAEGGTEWEIWFVFVCLLVATVIMCCVCCYCYCMREQAGEEEAEKDVEEGEEGEEELGETRLTGRFTFSSKSFAFTSPPPPPEKCPFSPVEVGKVVHDDKPGGGTTPPSTPPPEPHGKPEHAITLEAASPQPPTFPAQEHCSFSPITAASAPPTPLFRPSSSMRETLSSLLAGDYSLLEGEEETRAPLCGATSSPVESEDSAFEGGDYADGMDVEVFVQEDTRGGGAIEAAGAAPRLQWTVKNMVKQKPAKRWPKVAICDENNKNKYLFRGGVPKYPKGLIDRDAASGEAAEPGEIGKMREMIGRLI